jgi:hypothetical protein
LAKSALNTDTRWVVRARTASVRPDQRRGMLHRCTEGSLRGKQPFELDSDTYCIICSYETG